MDVIHNQLPEGEDPYTSMLFENGASLKVTLSFEGDFAELVDYTNNESMARIAIVSNVFGLIYAAFGGDAPISMEGQSDGSIEFTSEETE